MHMLFLRRNEHIQSFQNGDNLNHRAAGITYNTSDGMFIERNTWKKNKIKYQGMILV